MGRLLDVVLCAGHNLPGVVIAGSNTSDVNRLGRNNHGSILGVGAGTNYHVAHICDVAVDATTNNLGATVAGGKGDLAVGTLHLHTNQSDQFTAVFLHVQCTHADNLFGLCFQSCHRRNQLEVVLPGVAAHATYLVHVLAVVVIEGTDFRLFAIGTNIQAFQFDEHALTDRGFAEDATLVNAQIECAGAVRNV